MFGPKTVVKGETRMLTKLTSYLAHPYLDLPQKLCNMEFNEQLLSKMFFLLESNKVLLRVLSFKNSQEFPMKSEFLSKVVDRSSAFRDSYEYELNLKRDLLDIIAKFNEQSIKSIVIKSLNSLPLDSDNFDILVMKKNLSASFKVLRELDFVRTNWYHEPYKYLFEKTCMHAPKKLCTIHLHTAIAWGGIKFVDVKDLWKKYREKEIDGVTVGFPSTEHHLLTTIAHAFSENLEFRLGDLAYIIQDIQDNNIDWNYIFNWAIHDRWSDSFYGLLRLADHIYTLTFGDKLILEKTYELFAKEVKMNRNDLAEKLVDQFDKKPFLPMTIPITTVALQTGKKILTAPSITFLEKTKIISYLLNNFVKRTIPICKKHPVFLVCFIGQDGTGKTTHAKYVWKELKQIDKKIKVKYLWSRGFGYFFQPFLLVIRQLLLGSRSPKTQNRYISMRASLLKTEPMKSLWAYIMIIDHLLHLARVRLALSLGYIVICDRWINDTLIDVKCDLGKALNKFLEEKLERLVPKPEMTFVMDTETSELAKRRPEINPNLLEYKRYSYLKTSKRKGFKVIRTHEDLQRNRQTILSTVIESFFSQSI